MINLSLSILVTTLFFSTSTLADCRPQGAGDPVIYQSDFRWDYSLKEMLEKFKEIYVAPKRLYRRAYFSPSLNTYVLDVDTTQGVKQIRLSQSFLASVREHIEIALKRRYADAVFFPDMGHSHFFYTAKTKESLDKVDYPKDKNIFYEILFNAPDTKTLYHTAEQLKMRSGEKNRGPLFDDQELQWRYFSRNVIGQNDGTDNVATVFAFNENYNTLRELEGYEYFGAGFNVSANQNGCFEYVQNGEKKFFDLSMEDLPEIPREEIKDP